MDDDCNELVDGYVRSSAIFYAFFVIERAKSAIEQNVTGSLI
jgi:hypothetical protein